MPPNMTEYRDCTPAHGNVFAENHNKLVRIGSHRALIAHNHWVSNENGEHHQIALDFATDRSLASGAASHECQELAEKYFPEFTDAE